jgi:glycosyltransferase involved in cell wall biosynthesis
MKISVVISTYNRSHSLEKTLSALAVQSYDPNEYEVVVVDNGSADATQEVVAQMTRQYPTRRFRCERLERNVGPTGGRNKGLLEAAGKMVALTDDDCLPDRDWLRNAMPYFEDPRVGGVEGWTDKPPDETASLFAQYPRNVRGGKFPTCNMFYRSALLAEIGGFDPHFDRQAYFREDSDLAFGVLERGYQIVFAPDVKVFHPVHPGSAWRWVREARRLVNDGLLLKKHPCLYRERIGSLWSRAEGVAMMAGLGLVGSLGAQSWIASLGTFAVLTATSQYALIQTYLKGARFSLREWGAASAVSWLLPWAKSYWFLRGCLRYRPRAVDIVSLWRRGGTSPLPAGREEITE